MVSTRLAFTRIFLVGCPRSGTTLLQSMLARHDRVFTFPESHLFARSVPSGGLFRMAGLAGRHARCALSWKS